MSAPFALYAYALRAARSLIVGLRCLGERVRLTFVRRNFDSERRAFSALEYPCSVIIGRRTEAVSDPTCKTSAVPSVN